jgi:hypothetical protein
MNPAERLSLPQNLAGAAERQGRQPWLTTVLPEALAQARNRWSLTVGEPFQPGGQTAWVAPARSAAGADLMPARADLALAGADLVLKVADPRGLARRMAGLLDLDPDRVLSWLFARCVQESAEWPALAEVARTIAPA